MNDLEAILKEIEAPDKPPKPSNIGLWVVIIFVNVVGIALDAISAITVHNVTGGLWYYAVLTFFAGAVPFLMWELAYTRPYANDIQRSVSVIGIITGVFSIIVIGIASGIANVKGNVIAVDAELFIIVALVLLAVLHGVLGGIYFYSDDGIRAAQIASRTEARFRRKARNVALARTLLEMARGSVQSQRELADVFGNEAVQRILEILQDENRNGIPDILEHRSAFLRSTGNTEKNSSMPPSRLGG